MKGKSILITGGSGSFGNAFVERLLGEHIIHNDSVANRIAKRYDRIVIYSRDEHKQELMARKLGAWGIDHPVLRFFIGDVRSPNRLEMAMRGIDTVVHAAAMKIVPTAEYNPTECVATNIGGAENVIRAAIRCGVRKVIALSTDKAVNPVNLYGATKLCAEKMFIAANVLSAGDCAFSVMRYGNVVGSAGSVVHVFRRLLADGRPLTLTDLRMSRFWITMNQAVDFSLSCLDMMQGREIFVPKIPSIKITDLAKAFGGKSVTYTGIRPGEKLHETLVSTDEGRSTCDMDTYYAIYPHIKTNMPDGWSYRSDDNDYLTIDQIKETIK